MSARGGRRRSEATGATEATDATGATDATAPTAVPMTGTGAGPTPDPTTFAGTTGRAGDMRHRGTPRSTDDTAAE